MNSHVRGRLTSYKNMIIKIIITTRLDASYPDILAIKHRTYVRLLPFTPEQVNQLFNITKTDPTF
jgi:hypothetical protein